MLTPDMPNRTSPWTVPFNRPATAGRELEHVADSIAKMHISGDGEYGRRCEQILSQLHRGARVLLTTSCTHALELAALLLDVTAGDEVVLPSFTFVSTVNAFVLRGATPVFADIREDTLNLDHDQLPALVTPRTRVVVPMHYAGIACDMDPILDVAGTHGLAIVEDNAHGLFGEYRGAPLGTFGAMSALSFHETKNVVCGEGGALVINDPALVSRAEILREKGTDRSRFFRGEIDKYQWVDVGSSYVLSDLLAAYLFGQLERAQTIQETRRALWNRYQSALRDWAHSRGVRLPVTPADRTAAYHLFPLVTPDERSRDALIKHLASRGVQAIFHYLPLHQSPMGRRFGGYDGQCPITERVSKCLVRLPLYSGMREHEQDVVIEAVTTF